MKKKIIISCISIIVIAAGIFYYYYSKNKTPEYYWRTVPIEKGDVNVLVTATGSLRQQIAELYMLSY